MAGTSLHRPIGSRPGAREGTTHPRARSTRLRATRGSGSTKPPHSRPRISRRCPTTPSSGQLRTYAQVPGCRSRQGPPRLRAPRPSPSPRPRPRGSGASSERIAATRIRDNQRFLLLGAATLVLLLLLFGLVARDRGAPAPAAIPTNAPPTASVSSTIDAVLVALRPVEVTVTVDGVPETRDMEEGETLSFSADEELVLTVADGGAVQVTVAGRDLGAPGEPGSAWTDTFTFDVRPRPTRPPDRPRREPSGACRGRRGGYRAAARPDREHQRPLDR